MLTSQFIDALLAVPTLAAQSSRLQAADLLNDGGLTALLDTAAWLAGVNPEQSAQVARLCVQIGTVAGARAAASRAAYLEAQTHAIKGEFAEAERMIIEARAGFADLGLRQDALRTTAGLMRVLGETGRYQDALDAGQAALAELGVPSDEGVVREAAADRAVAAMIYQNCGFCYEQSGKYDAALSAYNAAAVRYAALGMVEQQAHIVENRGIVLMWLGQVSAALQAFQEAQRIYSAAGLDLHQGQTLINVGEAQLLLGNFIDSLQAFEMADCLFAPVGEVADRYILLRQMADAYLVLNLYGEALDAYRRANAGLAASGLTHHIAWTQWGMGICLAARGQLNEAQQALDTAGQIFQAADNQPLLSAVWLEQATLLDRLGQKEVARTLAQQALSLVSAGNSTVQKIYAYLRNADLALPDTDAAEAMLEQAQPLVAFVDLPPLRYRLQQRWGHLRLLQGDAAAAQTHLERAIDEIERLRSTLAHERMRASFLDDKMAAYQDLVRLNLDRGDADSIQAAFVVAERAKSRALVDLIAGVVQTKLDTPGDETANVQLLQLQAELNAIYNELLGGSESSARTADAAMLRARATELEQTMSLLQLRSTSALRAQAQQALPARFAGLEFPVQDRDLVFLVYHIVGDEVMAFVYKDGHIDVLRQLTTATQVQHLQQRLAAQWARFRTGPPFVERHLHQLEQSTQRLLHLLYMELVEPMRALLDTTGSSIEGALRRIVVVPHGLLHQLPFHAFYDGAHYLLEHFVISYAPSATVFQLCRQRQPRRSGSVLAVSVADVQIPAVAEEVRGVAARLSSQFPKVQVLIDQEATLANISAQAVDCSILHLACHGLFRRDNPMFSALRLYDGWLTAANVAQLQLPGALVTLSACESGRSQVSGGDEIIGLSYAFLSAGAAMLLVSQWLVQDSATAMLMDIWYRQLGACDDLAATLRAAQLEVMAIYPHPYYWAPFTLVGQRFWTAAS